MGGAPVGHPLLAPPLVTRLFEDACPLINEQAHNAFSDLLNNRFAKNKQIFSARQRVIAAKAGKQESGVTARRAGPRRVRARRDCRGDITNLTEDLRRSTASTRRGPRGLHPQTISTDVRQFRCPGTCTIENVRGPTGKRGRNLGDGTLTIHIGPRVAVQGGATAAHARPLRRCREERR